jgi:branched-chain amino acid transport system ATP-binding protein
VIGKLSTMRVRPFEGMTPALSKRISDLLVSLKGKDLTLLMSHSDLNHSHTLFDAKFVIERRANLST